MAKSLGKIVIIHGWNNRPSDGWLLWLADELRAEGYQVVAPALPLPYTPRPGKWVQALANQVGELDARTVIVGYSLGSAVGLRFLNDYARDVHIAGLVLVAGFGAGFRDQPASLFTPPLDYELLQHRAQRRICIYSDNDRLVPTKWSQALARQLQAREIVRVGAGHFVPFKHVPGGVAELPVVLEAVLSCYPKHRWQEFKLKLREMRGQLLAKHETK